MLPIRRLRTLRCSLGQPFSQQDRKDGLASSWLVAKVPCDSDAPVQPLPKERGTPAPWGSGHQCRKKGRCCADASQPGRCNEPAWSGRKI